MDPIPQLRPVFFFRFFHFFPPPPPLIIASVSPHPFRFCPSPWEQALFRGMTFLNHWSADSFFLTHRTRPNLFFSTPHPRSLLSFSAKRVFVNSLYFFAETKSLEEASLCGLNRILSPLLFFENNHSCLVFTLFPSVCPPSVYLVPITSPPFSSSNKTPHGHIKWISSL